MGLSHVILIFARSNDHLAQDSLRAMKSLIAKYVFPIQFR